MIQAKKTSIAIIFALLMLITYDIVQADQRELSHKDSLAYYSYGKDRVSQKNLNYGVKFMQEYLLKKLPLLRKVTSIGQD